MTPAQHAKEAERLLTLADEYEEASRWRMEIYARAQIHATLALRTSATKAKS